MLYFLSCNFWKYSTVFAFDPPTQNTLFLVIMHIGKVPAITHHIFYMSALT